MSKVIQIHLSNQITLQKPELSPGLLHQIKAYLTMENPKYREAEERGYWTGNIPQYLFAYSEDADHLYCCRGYLGLLIPFLCKSGLKYQLIDQRRRLPEVDYTFSGNLREYQQQAVVAALQKHFGILVAPCGAGKTTMALAIVAERN